jgi:hypothetical protein
MTIAGWGFFVTLSIFAVMLGFAGWVYFEDSAGGKALSVVLTIGIIAGMFFGFRWYYTSTASGQRAVVDQRAELNSGLERTITIYTADGNQIAQYTGKIDIEGNDGGYVLFDFDGKRYTYYNCFVESIAEIGG